MCRLQAFSIKNIQTTTFIHQVYTKRYIYASLYLRCADHCGYRLGRAPGYRYQARLQLCRYSLRTLPAGHSYRWGVFCLYFSILLHVTRLLLPVLQDKEGGLTDVIPLSNEDCTFRLRFTMGSDILLGSLIRQSGIGKPHQSALFVHATPTVCFRCCICCYQTQSA